MASHSSPQAPSLFPEENQLAVSDALTITGSRDISDFDPEPLFRTALGSFMGQQRIWLLGGALGIDHMAIKWLLANQEQVVAIVPFTIREQPVAVHETLGKVHRCIELRYGKTKKAYLDRNTYMVDRSIAVIAFWNGEKGGTWATVQYAMKARKQVHVYPI
jgi:predicted Rossmann fold nucleotide-binding protein DprA/Smf involved in DNA uptake